MANPEHLAKLHEGVETWNRWREENPEIVPDLREAYLHEAKLMGVNFMRADLEGAILIGAQLEEANLSWAYLKGTSFRAAQLNRTDLMKAHLERADLYRAQLEGADLSRSYLESANLMKSHLGGANLRFSDLSKADLRECKGISFDESITLYSRLTTRPGNFLNRIFNPKFIYNPITDPWSELRRAYTGPNFLITLLALIAFLLPYVFQIATWRGVNLAQELMQSTLTDLRQDYEALVALGEVPPASAPPLERALARLESYDTCLAQTCERYHIWQLLLGWNKGWLFVVMTLAIFSYNLIRYHLTQKISAFREEEERSSYTPALSEYFTPNLFGIYSDSTKAPTWLRRIVPIIGLSPTRLHVVLRILFLLATTAFGFSLYDVLSTVVNLRP